MSRVSPTLDFDLLRCFSAVAQSGGFTAAGRRLGLSQSAVSAKVKALEELLGGRRVFARTSRSLALTPEGEQLLARAAQMLELHDEIVRGLLEPALAGPLRLGVADYFVPQHLPRILARFARAYPQVSLEVQSGTSPELHAAYGRGELDLVIANRDESARPGATRDGGRVLLREPLRWVAGPGWKRPPGAGSRRAGSSAPARGQGSGPGRDLLAAVLPLAMLPEPCSYRRESLSALQAAGCRWRIVFASTSLASIQAAVLAGLAVSVLPRSVILPGMQVLTAARDGLPELPAAEVVVYSGEGSGRQPLVRPLVRFLVEHFADGRPPENDQGENRGVSRS